MKSHTNAISRLEYLFKRTFFFQKGLKIACEHINKKNLKRWLIEYTEQRTRHMKELRFEVARLGVLPNNPTKVSKKLHDFWQSLNLDFTKPHDYDILRNCIKQEEAMLSVYEEISDTLMPKKTKLVLSQQREQIEQKISYLEKLSLLHPVQERQTA